MCYVDDPLAAIMGTDEDRELFTAIIVLVWEALGFQLAYSKGQQGHNVTWIGGTLTVEAEGVRAKVKQSIIDDICDDIARLTKQNITTLTELHSLVGKLNHAAGLIIYIRPYLEPLWGALYSDGVSGAPRNTIWTKQIITSLTWFQALFTRDKPLERFFRLDAYSGTGTAVEIGTDASPWGMGGWLTISGVITYFFSCPVDEGDVRKLGLIYGDSSSQQILECLALLIAVDLWAFLWKEDRIQLKISGDNVTALTLLIKLRPDKDCPAMGIIARELALRLAELSFPPDAIHTPGVAHVIADRLSRVHAPGGTGVVDTSIHFALEHAKLSIPAVRDDQWYRAYK